MLNLLKNISPLRDHLTETSKADALPIPICKTPPQSSIIKVVASSFIPRLFNDESWTTFKYIAETTHTILCKVIEHYLTHPSYRTIFSYDKRLEELILLPRGYEDTLPFARIDVFLNEDDLSCGFCEFNLGTALRE